MLIRSATDADADAIWLILEPTIRAGETYPLERDMGKREALAYWLARLHQLRGLGDPKVLKSLGRSSKGRHYRG